MLKSCKVTDKRLKRKLLSLLSPDYWVKCRPSLIRKWKASWFMGPRVSNAIGRKVYMDARLIYLLVDVFLTATASAVAPAVSKVVGKYVGNCVC